MFEEEEETLRNQDGSGRQIHAWRTKPIVCLHKLQIEHERSKRRSEQCKDTTNTTTYLSSHEWSLRSEKAAHEDRSKKQEENQRKKCLLSSDACPGGKVNNLSVHAEEETEKRKEKGNEIAKAVNRKSHFKLHQKTPKAEKEYTCLECGKSFNSCSGYRVATLVGTTPPTRPHHTPVTPPANCLRSRSNDDGSKQLGDQLTLKKDMYTQRTTGKITKQIARTCREGVRNRDVTRVRVTRCRRTTKSDVIAGSDIIKQIKSNK